MSYINCETCFMVLCYMSVKIVQFPSVWKIKIKKKYKSIGGTRLTTTHVREEPIQLSQVHLPSPPTWQEAKFGRAHVVKV